MIFRTDTATPGRWFEAFGLSVALHVAIIVGVALWVSGPRGGTDAPDTPVVTISTLIVTDTPLPPDPPADPIPDDTPQPAGEAPLPDETPPDSPSDPADPQPETVEPVPDPDELVPETIAPAAPPVDTLSPVQPDPDALVAIVPESTGTVEGLGPSIGAGETLSALPTVPPPPPPPPQGGGAEIDPDLAEMIRRIRADISAPCLAALPRQQADGDLQLTLIASDIDLMIRQDSALTRDLTAAITTQLYEVDPRQCAALSFVRGVARYPALGLAITPSFDQVDSGDLVSGVIRGGAGRYVTLLLVDDNGVVQDLSRFLTIAGPDARFDVPVFRNGPSRDTRQLLIALATAGRPAALDQMAGQLAGDMFPALQSELQGARIGIVAIGVD